MKIGILYLKRSFLVLLFFPALLLADAPDGYYSSAEGNADARLKTALYDIIKGHIQRDYYAVASFFEQYDLTPDGYIWDMYSNRRCTQWYGCNLNREHNMPKSWFGISGGQENTDPIGCDYHNLFPSDVTANSAKSNYAMGMTTGGSFNNGVSKVGANTYPGYSGTVFEPADEYKGDFARNFMYMVTRYESYAGRWQSTGTSSMLRNNTYPVFNTYAVNLLMEWHREDPVSEKEISRNDGIYSYQNNRNPFVDFPELAEHIWGNLKGKKWYVNGVPTQMVSPNPAIDIITIKVSRPVGENAYYEIYSISGVLCQKDILAENGQIGLAALGNGLYIIAVYSSGQRYTQKFIINKSGQ